LLEVRNLSKFFGGIHAVDDASLTIEQGSITGLIGPNGAGKTTLFNVISGLYRPDAGQVYFDGQNITGKAPHELFGDGILRTFQIAHEFSTLSVRENLMVVPSGQSGERLVDTWFRPSNVAHQELQNQERANEVIDFLQLTGVANELAGNLSGGQKKLLELGRTMMAKPKIVFLDEVGAGVNRTLAKIQHSEQRFHCRRFTGAIWPHDDHDFAFIDCNGAILKNVSGAVPAEHGLTF